MHTAPVPVTRSHEHSFLPLLATLAGGVAMITLVLCGTVDLPPAFGVILDTAVTMLFVGAVLLGVNRLLAESGDADA